MNTDNSVNELIRQALLRNATSDDIEKLKENVVNVTKGIDDQVKERAEKYRDVIGEVFEGGNLNVVEMKPTESFTNDIKNAIKVLVHKKKDAEVFGSFMYRAQSFPGDIDIHEFVDVCCSPEKAVQKMAKILQKIVKRVQETKGYYFSEVKSGNDLRFMLDINSPDYVERLDELKDEELLTNDEYDRLKSALFTKNKDERDVIEEEIRNLQVLRWSAKEVLQGYKILRGDKVITLAESMNMKGHIKIDVLIPINGRYNEVTNFFILGYYDPSGNSHLINTSDFNYIDAILEQIEKLSSKTFFNPFKLAKRMWGLARHTKDEKMLDLLTPLMQSGIARMNQIKSEIEVIQLILEKVKSPPLSTIKKQIDEFKSRLSYVYDVKFDDLQIYNMIDKIVNQKMSREKMHEYLEAMKKLIKKTISDHALEFLKSNRLFPFNKNLFNLSGRSKKKFEIPKYNMMRKAVGEGTVEGAAKNKWIKYLRNYRPKIGGKEEFQRYKAEYKKGIIRISPKNKNKKISEEEYLKGIEKYSRDKKKQLQKDLDFLKQLDKKDKRKEEIKDIEKYSSKKDEELQRDLDFLQELEISNKERQKKEKRELFNAIRNGIEDKYLEFMDKEYQDEDYGQSEKFWKEIDKQVLQLTRGIYGQFIEPQTVKIEDLDDYEELFEKVADTIPEKDLEPLNILIPFFSPNVPVDDKFENIKVDPIEEIDKLSDRGVEVLDKVIEHVIEDLTEDVPIPPPMDEDIPVPPSIDPATIEAVKKVEPLIRESVEQMKPGEVKKLDNVPISSINIYCGSQGQGPRVTFAEPLETGPTPTIPKITTKFPEVQTVQGPRPKKPGEETVKFGKDKYASVPRKKLVLDPEFIKDLEKRYSADT